MSYRAQLSVTDSRDMRVHYSGYFLNLLAATELCRETTLQPNDFEAQLFARLVFNGHSDGEANYGFIRELRNAVVHRGLDITAAAHFDGSFPMVLAEPVVQNQRRTKSFNTFDKYLLQVIAKCEAVVGPVMLDWLSAAGIFQTTVDVAAAGAEYRAGVEQSRAMPEFAKKFARTVEFKPEWALQIHQSTLTRVREVLAPCSMAVRT